MKYHYQQSRLKMVTPSMTFMTRPSGSTTTQPRSPEDNPALEATVTLVPMVTLAPKVTPACRGATVLMVIRGLRGIPTLKAKNVPGPAKGQATTPDLPDPTTIHILGIVQGSLGSIQGPESRIIVRDPLIILNPPTVHNLIPLIRLLHRKSRQLGTLSRLSWRP